MQTRRSSLEPADKSTEAEEDRGSGYQETRQTSSRREGVRLIIRGTCLQSLNIAANRAQGDNETRLKTRDANMLERHEQLSIARSRLKASRGLSSPLPSSVDDQAKTEGVYWLIGVATFTTMMKLEVGQSAGAHPSSIAATHHWTTDYRFCTSLRAW